MPNEVAGFKINGSTYEYDHDHLANLPAIDATPTANSTNAVQSGGVRSALDELQAEIPTVDATPTQGSSNAVSSGGVYDVTSALDERIEALEQGGSGLTEEAKVALLACFEHVAWIDERGQNYYDALESALYANQYPKITVTFDSGTHSIYNVYDLDDLKQYLTVRYYEDAQDDGGVISSANYSLSGILNVGNSAINVSYNNLTAVFSVQVLDYYNKYSWNPSSDSDVITFVNGIFDTYTYNGKSSIKYTGNNTTTRRQLAGLFGESSILASDGVSDTNWYCIPIPDGATQLTVTFDSDINISVQWKKKYTGEEHIYAWIGDSGWQSGTTYTASIPTHETRGRANCFLINTKKSDGSAFSVNPTISLLFE